MLANKLLLQKNKEGLKDHCNEHINSYSCSYLLSIID